MERSPANNGVRPWRRTCLSTGRMYTSRECSRSSSSTVCIDWTCGAAESADVNRPAELQLPRSHSVESSAICSARRQSLTEHLHAAAKDLSVWTVTAQHPAPWWRFVIPSPSSTYLLTCRVFDASPLARMTGNCFCSSSSSSSSSSDVYITWHSWHH